MSLNKPINFLNKNSRKVAYENNDKKMESVYSKRVKAGKRRTYFFDVRETRGNDFFLTITESRKKFDSEGYDRTKIFLYKEDFNKFVKGLNEAVDHVKTELMPDFDFDAFSHEDDEEGYNNSYNAPTTENASTEEETPVVTMAAEPEATLTTEQDEAKPDASSGDNLADVPADKW